MIDPPPTQHHSVQWNETDLEHLTRRLEADGLFFFWRHDAGAHRLHLASHAAGYVGGEDVRFAMGSTDRDHINRFETTFRYTPGGHAGRDWNFETPGIVPGGGTPSLVSLPKNGNYERFEYPMQAGYGSGARASEGIEDAQVVRVSRLRMQAMEAEHARIDGPEVHPNGYDRIKRWFPFGPPRRKGRHRHLLDPREAEPGSGGQVIPRIGMEVMVTYLDGDPDRPVVTGVVPNARQTVPYALPEHKARSTFRTQTHKDDGFNELRLEDAVQTEEIMLCGQKDLTLKCAEQFHCPDRPQRRWICRPQPVSGNGRQRRSPCWWQHEC